MPTQLLGIGTTTERDSLPIKRSLDRWFNIDTETEEIYHAPTNLWYPMPASGGGGGSISTDPLAVDGDIEMQTDNTIWLDTAKTTGFRHDANRLGAVEVLSFALTSYHPVFSIINDSSDAYIQLLGDNNTAVGVNLLVEGTIDVFGFPTSVDPAVTGRLFTCTEAERAALVTAGAKYVLLSKGP